MIAPASREAGLSARSRLEQQFRAYMHTHSSVIQRKSRTDGTCTSYIFFSYISYITEHQPTPHHPPTPSTDTPVTKFKFDILSAFTARPHQSAKLDHLGLAALRSTKITKMPRLEALCPSQTQSVSMNYCFRSMCCPSRQVALL